MCVKASVLLLLLPLLSGLTSESTATAHDDTGLKFIVVFPENIAYYYPTQPKNQVQITALHDGTVVNIKSYIYHETTETMNAGETEDFIFDARLELKKSEISNRTIQITSNKNITVKSISLKNNSVQTALVVPTEKLGTKYLIPPVPDIQGTTDPASGVTTGVTERGPFRIVLVNADQENTVTVEGSGSTEVSLQPNQAAQVWLDQEEDFRVVKATMPLAVLFSHPCAIWYNCTCGLLNAMLPPAGDETLKFFIPPVLAEDAGGKTFVLLSETGSNSPKVFDPESPKVETAGAAVLYRPGLLLTLIPDSDFAACFVVTSIPDVQNSAVIVVHEDLTDGVRVGNNPLSSPRWQKLQGTEYVSAVVDLPTSGKSVVWHTSSKMSVYYRGKNGSALFGNPAPIISKTPDVRGCVLTPEVITIGEVADGWRESLKYCEDKDLDLIGFSATHSPGLFEVLSEAKNADLQEVWIGMRRSSQTGEWYWVNRDPVNATNWQQGEPGKVDEGQCAKMSLENSKDFGWSDEDCCEDIRPVCYRKPKLLPM